MITTKQFSVNHLIQTINSQCFEENVINFSFFGRHFGFIAAANAKPIICQLFS